MAEGFTESVVEDAALAWLESLGYAVKHGPEIAPGELFAERGDYGQVILTTRLREALVRLNPTLPAEAIDDAFRKIIRLEGATLDARNRTFHRLLVDGVTVEYRTDGSIRGAQAQLIDFKDQDNNDWLAVNQFTLTEGQQTRRPNVVLFVNGLPLPEEFAYCLARSSEFRDFAIQSMNGSSGRQRVPAESLSLFRVVVASKSVAEFFSRLIKPLFARASAASKEGRTLAAIRDALLPKLLSGELRLQNAERGIENV